MLPDLRTSSERQSFKDGCCCKEAPYYDIIDYFHMYPTGQDREYIK